MDRDVVIEAIRGSWSRATASEPDEWSPENPAKGHCDVSSFVAREYLGGNLVLSKVMVDGEQTEHHYWNRLDGGEDLDLTREQFTGSEEIIELRELDQMFMDAQGPIKSEVAARIDRFRKLVQENLSG